GRFHQDGPGSLAGRSRGCALATPPSALSARDQFAGSIRRRRRPRRQPEARGIGRWRRLGRDFIRASGAARIRKEFEYPWKTTTTDGGSLRRIGKSIGTSSGSCFPPLLRLSLPRRRSPAARTFSMLERDPVSLRSALPDVSETKVRSQASILLPR